MQPQICTIASDSIPTPYERSRASVSDYYTHGEGAKDTAPFALLFFLRDQESGAGIAELCKSRLDFTPEAKAYSRSVIRRNVYKGIERAQRHRLVTIVDRRYVLTTKGRQFVMGGLHSRTAMLKRVGLRHTVMEVCMLCTEEELAPSVQQEATPKTWKTEIGSSWLGPWLRTSCLAPVGMQQASD